MQLFNTQTGQLERFTPRDGKVGLYVCGITPYDTTHIGHAFTFLTFDIMIRHMRRKGWDVTYVQNVTDIDDDILRKAKEVGLGWRELGERETSRYRTDMRNQPGDLCRIVGRDDFHRIPIEPRGRRGSDARIVKQDERT